jgi:hypothetical protein
MSLWSGLNAYCLTRPYGNQNLPPCELIAGHRGPHWTPREKRSPVTTTEGVEGYYGYVDPALQERTRAELDNYNAARNERRWQRALKRDESSLGGVEWDGRADAPAA